MKKTTTYFKILLAVFIIMQSKSFAQTYPVYICGTGTQVTLVPTNVTINSGDQVVWVETTGGTNTTVQSGTTANYTTPTGLSVGEHSYKVHIISATPASCTGDASTEYKIYKLPSTTVNLAAPSAANYCENASPSPSSTIVATSTPASTLPSGVTYSYTWSVTKDASTIVASTIGSDASSSNTLTNTFTMNTTNIGEYIFTASASYAVPSGSVLKSSDDAGCATPSTNTRTVTVAPKPGQPTIDIL